jgi:hypothetical protein
MLTFSPVKPQHPHSTRSRPTTKLHVMPDAQIRTGPDKMKFQTEEQINRPSLDLSVSQHQSWATGQSQYALMALIQSYHYDLWSSSVTRFAGITAILNR